MVGQAGVEPTWWLKRFTAVPLADRATTPFTNGLRANSGIEPDLNQPLLESDLFAHITFMVGIERLELSTED